jgi:hypothetical protein
MILARLALTGALLLAGNLQGKDPAQADAALAVGQPADVAKQGLAVGWAVNHASKEAAEKEALARCREFREAPQATREACRVVETSANAVWRWRSIPTPARRAWAGPCTEAATGRRMWRWSGAPRSPPPSADSSAAWRSSAATGGKARVYPMRMRVAVTNL